jgi:Nickel responsive protein SCO4226-like
MPNFLVEVYAPRNAALTELVAAARGATVRDSESGRIGYVDSILVPDDETCFHVFRGPSALAVAAVAKRAGLPFQRVVGPVLQQSGGVDPVGRGG